MLKIYGGGGSGPNLPRKCFNKILLASMHTSVVHSVLCLHRIRHVICKKRHFFFWLWLGTTHPLRARPTTETLHLCNFYFCLDTYSSYWIYLSTLNVLVKPNLRHPTAGTPAHMRTVHDARGTAPCAWHKSFAFTHLRKIKWRYPSSVFLLWLRWRRQLLLSLPRLASALPLSKSVTF